MDISNVTHEIIIIETVLDLKNLTSNQTQLEEEKFGSMK